MTNYEYELQRLRPDDEVQFTEDVMKYNFIHTSSHGYLVVPRNHPDFKRALAIVKFGYIGDYAVYLEEDCEASDFFNSNVKVGL